MITDACQLDLGVVDRVVNIAVFKELPELISNHDRTVFLSLDRRCAQMRQCNHPIMAFQILRRKVANIGTEFTGIQRI